MSKYLSLIFGLAIVPLFHAGCGELESPTGVPDETLHNACA